MGWDARSRERPVEVVLAQEETLRKVIDVVGGYGLEYVGKRTGRVPAAEEPEVDAAIQDDAAVGSHPGAGAEDVVAAVVALAVKDGDDAGKDETYVSSALKKNKKNRVFSVHASLCGMKCIVYLGERLRLEHRKQIPGFVWGSKNGNPSLFQRFFFG